jgi:hypothetical protein
MLLLCQDATYHASLQKELYEKNKHIHTTCPHRSEHATANKKMAAGSLTTIAKSISGSAEETRKIAGRMGATANEGLLKESSVVGELRDIKQSLSSIAQSLHSVVIKMKEREEDRKNFARNFVVAA